MIAEELYPRIMVFHNALENPQEFEESLQEGSPYVKPWTNWYDLGKQSFFTSYPEVATPKFPTVDEWEGEWINVANPIARLAGQILYACTRQYVERYEVNMPEWRAPVPFILSHDSRSSNGQLAMQYHTDFKMAETDMPGFKFWLTCLLYVNDDYEGGEIAFKIFKDDTSLSRTAECDCFRYKPRAGDMLILPSHHPYWHGVRKTLNNRKLFLRMFWGYNSLGTEEWRANERLYGKDKWASMEEERAKREVNSGQWFMGTVEETDTKYEVS